MANRLVSVDDNLNLPPAVQAKLSNNVRAEFQGYLNSSQSAANTATSAASVASAAAAQAVAVSTGDLDPANALLIEDDDSQTRHALEQIFVSASVNDPTIINAAIALPSTGDVGPALNDVIAGAAKGDVIVGDPAVTYTLSSTVVINKGVTLRNLNFSTGSFIGTALRVEASDVTLDGVSVVGATNAATPELPNYHVFVAGTKAAPIDRLRIVNCSFRYNLGTVIRAEWCRNFYIAHNVIRDGQYGGIMMISPKVGMIENNYVDSLLQSAPLVNSYGIGVTDMDNDAPSRAEHVTIIGNYVSNVKSWTAFDTHSGLGIKFIGNTAWNCWLGINVVPGNAERLLAPQDCVVANNVVVRVDTPAQNAGIVFSGRATLLTSGYMGGNVIRGYDTPYVAVALDPAAFRRDGKMVAYGSFTVAVPANGFVNTPITFPAGMFREAPFITMNATSGRLNLAVTSPTKDGASIGANNWTTAAANGVTVEWKAEER